MSLKAARNIGVVAVVALAVALLPGGGDTAQLVLGALSLGFLAAIGFLGYRLYMENRFTLWSMSVRHRALLEQLPAPIRVETIRLYNAKLSSMPKGARGQRKEVDAGYVNVLIQQARENCTLKYREW